MTTQMEFARRGSVRDDLRSVAERGGGGLTN